MSLVLKNGIDTQCPDYSKFRIAPQSVISCLRPTMCKQVGDIVRKHFGDTYEIRDIMDATANIGCDSINFFHRFGASIISIEIDETIHNLLAMNHQNFNVDGHAVHGNCLDFIKGFKKWMDFVYFDPPWGGSKYKKKIKMMLYLNHNNRKVPIYTVVDMVFTEGFTNTVVIKVPRNFNMEKFRSKLVDKVCNQFPIYYKNKLSYYIVICST
jgi:16S rRNA G966 N2-methylase RsmD